MNEEFWSNPGTTHIIQEYRIVLPLSVEEYEIGQRYCTAELHKELHKEAHEFHWTSNEPMKIENDIAQHTTKNINFCKLNFPKGFLKFSEESVNNYPGCRTWYSNEYMKKNFHIVVDSRHESGLGGEDNIFDLNEEELNRRKVEVIDIVNAPIKKSKCDDAKDPAEFRSEKYDRGPFQGVGWEQNQKPVMCVYKLYRIEFKWWGLQWIIEKMIVKAIREILFNFTRRVVCSMDSWMEMSLEDIEKYDDENMAEMTFDEKSKLPFEKTKN